MVGRTTFQQHSTTLRPGIGGPGAPPSRGWGEFSPRSPRNAKGYNEHSLVADLASGGLACRNNVGQSRVDSSAQQPTYSEGVEGQHRCLWTALPDPRRAGGSAASSRTQSGCSTPLTTASSGHNGRVRRPASAKHAGSAPTGGGYPQNQPVGDDWFLTQTKAVHCGVSPRDYQSGFASPRAGQFDEYKNEGKKTHYNGAAQWVLSTADVSETAQASSRKTSSEAVMGQYPAGQSPAGCKAGRLENRAQSPRMYHEESSRVLDDRHHRQIFAQAAGVRSGRVNERKIKEASKTAPNKVGNVDAVVFSRDTDRLRSNDSFAVYEGAAGMNTKCLHGDPWHESGQGRRRSNSNPSRGSPLLARADRD